MCLQTGRYFRYKLTYNIMLILFSMMFFSCENSLTIVKEITAEDTLAAVTANDIIYYRSDSGMVFMKLEAPLMLRVEGNDPTIEFPLGFVANFYDSVQQPASLIRAKYGVTHENTQIMIARDSVEVENFQTLEKLQSSTLFWNQKTKRIYTQALVKITSPDKVVYGDSLEAAEDFSTRTIYNIRATIEVEESEDY
jgi:LPS export ABC transporter protein LptC